MLPGGASIHCMMTPHGPDSESFNAATNAKNEVFRIPFGNQVN